MFGYLDRALDDPVFWRIAMGLWSIPMFYVVFEFVTEWPEICGNYWLIAIPVVALCIGVWLIYSSIFSDDSTIKKRSEILGGNGTEVVVFAVLLVGVPIYELRKLLVGRKQNK